MSEGRGNVSSVLLAEAILLLKYMNDNTQEDQRNLLPRKVHQIDPKTLGIDWVDDHNSVYNIKMLRERCPCANCIDEWTGEKRLDPASVPENIKPINLKSVGRYAIQFQWTDGHDTGLYTYNLLRKLCECKECIPS